MRDRETKTKEKGRQGDRETHRKERGEREKIKRVGEKEGQNRGR